MVTCNLHGGWLCFLLLLTNLPLTCSYGLVYWFYNCKKKTSFANYFQWFCHGNLLNIFQIESKNVSYGYIKTCHAMLPLIHWPQEIYVKCKFEANYSDSWLKYLNEYDWISLIISQRWFKQWLVASRQQTITWPSVGPGLYCHMASLDHKELILRWVQLW